jgi:hypothetical protein
MYCENCGAKHGETVEQNMKRMNKFGAAAYDAVHRVVGRLCQFCAELPATRSSYDTETGKAIAFRR